MKEDYVNKNGNLVLRSELGLGINRAMRFGDGIFETIRIINGELVWWAEHFDRLQKGMNYLGFKFPELFIDELLVDCLATIHRNQIKEGGILRIIVFRKGGAGYTPTSYKFEYLIETESLEQNQFELNTKGLKIGISETVKINSKENQEIKSLNKIPYIRASIEKVQKGYDDILITNENGVIAEGSSSNLFLLYNNKWYTPSISHGALSGITRNKVIDIIKVKGDKIALTKVDAELLLAADEIFLTNAVSGMKWVGSFQKKRYYNKKSKQICQLLPK